METVWLYTKNKKVLIQIKRMAESYEGNETKRGKGENLEVTGVSRCGRVRKKSSKLMDFESPDEVENRHKRKPNIEVPVLPQKKKSPKKPPKTETELVVVNHPEDEDSFPVQDSDAESDLYHPTEEEENDDEDYEVEDEEEDEPEDDDDDDYNEGQLVVDEKTPTQSLYMMEKSKKKLVVKDGRVVGTTKAQRKDKGQARFTAYMMWAKEVRQELTKQYPDMDFTTMARRLSELWGTVPHSERELWRRKAKREAAKKPKVMKPEAPLMPSRKFINKKGGPPQPPVSHTHTQAHTSHAPAPPETSQVQVRKQTDPVTMTGLYKVTGIQPIDVAAHLKLLGESLSIIGERLQEHEGQIAVSGSLSVLLDSLLCAMGPLLCLTQQVEELQDDTQVYNKMLQDIAYLMPGLG